MKHCSNMLPVQPFFSPTLTRAGTVRVSAVPVNPNIESPMMGRIRGSLSEDPVTPETRLSEPVRPARDSGGRFRSRTIADRFATPQRTSQVPTNLFTSPINPSRVIESHVEDINSSNRKLFSLMDILVRGTADLIHNKYLDTLRNPQTSFLPPSVDELKSTMLLSINRANGLPFDIREFADNHAELIAATMNKIHEQGEAMVRNAKLGTGTVYKDLMDQILDDAFGQFGGNIEDLQLSFLEADTPVPAYINEKVDEEDPRSVTDSGSAVPVPNITDTSPPSEDAEQTRPVFPETPIRPGNTFESAFTGALGQTPEQVLTRTPSQTVPVFSDLEDETETGMGTGTQTGPQGRQSGTQTEPEGRESETQTEPQETETAQETATAARQEERVEGRANLSNQERVFQGFINQQQIQINDLLNFMRNVQPQERTQERPNLERIVEELQARQRMQEMLENERRKNENNQRVSQIEETFKKQINDLKEKVEKIKELDECCTPKVLVQTGSGTIRQTGHDLDHKKPGLDKQKHRAIHAIKRNCQCKNVLGKKPVCTCTTSSEPFKKRKIIK